MFAAVVAAAALTRGSAGYLLAVVDLPETSLIVLVVAVMTAVAAWGIMESIALAGFFTLIEVGGLIVVIGLGGWQQPGLLAALPEVLPSVSDHVAWLALFNASLLAFFAFIGFNDIVNLAEETRDPARAMPAAIALTLVVATLLYFLVTWVAVRTVSVTELAASRAPIGLLFERITGWSPLAITVIAIVATVNGVIIQLILASRVLYGLASRGSLPLLFGRIHPRTRTPLFGTMAVGALILLFTLVFPLAGLAQATSQSILVVFLLVCLALIRLKLRRIPPPAGTFVVGLWVPLGGSFCCLIMLFVPVIVALASG